MKLAIRSTQNGNYVVTEQSSGATNEELIANRASIGPWEKFNVLIQETTQPSGPRLLEIKLQASDTNKYIKVDTNDSNTLKGSEDTAATATVFQVFPTGIGFAFRDKATEKFVTITSTDPILKANNDNLHSLDGLFEAVWVN